MARKLVSFFVLVPLNQPTLSNESNPAVASLTFPYSTQVLFQQFYSATAANSYSATAATFEFTHRLGGGVLDVSATAAEA